NAQANISVFHWFHVLCFQFAVFSAFKMVGGVTTDNASIALLFPERSDVAIARASVGVDQWWQHSYHYDCLTAFPVRSVRLSAATMLWNILA
ncbi:hypothetical protein ABTM96_19530, partial [Acinetobacter baumannii]